MTPYFTASYRPARNSRRGSVESSSGIDEHGEGLVIRADQVLAERMVDAGLAADGAVDLREQRRRDLHDRNAAQVGGRGKAGRVAHDPAAERHDAAGAIRHALISAS